MGELINWINVSQNAAFRIDVDVILGLRIIITLSVTQFQYKDALLSQHNSHYKDKTF